jgi:hypothetical protein
MASPLTILRNRFDRAVTLPRLAKDCDAILASFPKSGRTWFRFILSNYFNDVFALGQDVDLHSTFRIVPNLDLDKERGIPSFRFRDRRPAMPLVLVTHLDYSARLFNDRPVIFLVRDPRDVLVSSYYHATRHKHRFTGGIDEFLKDPEQGARHLVVYLNRWAAGIEAHRHLVLDYESLSADPVASTRKALEFLGCGVDDAALVRAVEASRFEAMREIEQRVGIPGHDYDRGDEQSLRMRKGKAGGFTDELSAAQIAWVDRTLGATLSPAARKHLGLDRYAG